MEGQDKTETMWVNVEGEVFTRSQTMRNGQRSFVQAHQQRHLCSPAPLDTAGEDLEREMVSSRLFLITRGCASRCNRIPEERSRKEMCICLCVTPLVCVCVCVCILVITQWARFERL